MHGSIGVMSWESWRATILTVRGVSIHHESCSSILIVALHECLQRMLKRGDVFTAKNPVCSGCAIERN